MAMPTDVGIIDTMIGFPHEDMKELYEFITRADEGPGVEGGLRVPGRVHVQGRARQGARADVDDPIAVTLARDGPVGHREGRRSASATTAAPASWRSSATPTGSSPSVERRPQRGHGRPSARSSQAYETCGIRAVSMFPPGTFPQVADQRQEDVPDLRQVRASSASRCSCCAGVPGPAAAVRAAARRAHRRGHVRLPRAHLRDPPRLRAVGRTSR